MRVLHLIPNLVSGGAERQLTYLALELSRRGHDVHIGYLAESPVPAELSVSAVTLHPLSNNGTHDPVIFFRVFYLLRRLRPDILQTWILQMDVLGGCAAWLTHTPWVLREPASAKLWLPGLKTSIRLFVARAARFVVSNSMAGDDYWRTFKRDNQRQIISNAVPLQRILDVEPAMLDPALRLDGRRIVLFAGRFDAQKNIEVLLTALIDIVQRAPASAILVGEGPLGPRMREMIDGSGQGGRIKLMAYSSNLWSIMKVASLFVSISRFEGRPNVVLEAMAAGCPVLVSDIPEHREILDEASGIFVGCYEDPHAVAEGLLQALSDHSAVCRRIVLARDRVAAFTIERLGREYEMLYDRMLGR